ncbi:hypothetical protein BCR34DRAFT_593605 [Clohesyomyces aquaticus]|uniref:Uncharacterized protein n=1 Tax=Clohesyomyces aquaticus TaxID=1231657 RepID=A0A1Y1YGP3_9PLEO|nr:hypothetical protein BCR34DRAFT_593605 [Clohesyomyces aquaticus]
MYGWDGLRCCTRRLLHLDNRASTLLQFLGTNAFEYVRAIEIHVDLEFSIDINWLILQDFADKLRARRARHLTIKFTAATLTVEGEEAKEAETEENEVEFLRLLQALRGVPGFTDVIFEVADLSKGEDAQHLVERASAMRDSLLRGTKLRRAAPPVTVRKGRLAGQSGNHNGLELTKGRSRPPGSYYNP